MAEKIAFLKIAATGGHRHRGSSAKGHPPWGVVQCASAFPGGVHCGQVPGCAQQQRRPAGGRPCLDGPGGEQRPGVMLHSPQERQAQEGWLGQGLAVAPGAEGLVFALQFALFRFDCSSHAISMSTYLKEQMEELRDEVGAWAIGRGEGGLSMHWP